MNPTRTPARSRSLRVNRLSWREARSAAASAPPTHVIPAHVIVMAAHDPVIPAQAGIQRARGQRRARVDSRLHLSDQFNRRNNDSGPHQPVHA